MPGTKAGGRKASRKLRAKRRQQAQFGAQGGKAKVPKGFAVSGKARSAGSAGGKARAAKYQDPNFNKELYRARRAAGLPGVEKPRTVVSSLSPDEYLRRTNPAELERQKGGSNVKVNTKANNAKASAPKQIH